jgi:hypothetical protein
MAQPTLKDVLKAISELDAKVDRRVGDVERKVGNVDTKLGDVARHRGDGPRQEDADLSP